MAPKIGRNSDHEAENRELLIQGLKRCSNCNRVKPVRLFHKHHGGRLHPHCKACRKKAGASNYARHRYYEKTYGLTLEEYEKILEAQQGKCFICQGGSTKNLAVDHNHKNGRVRGLLCTPCNSILARWKDDPQAVRRALLYLASDGQWIQALGINAKGLVLEPEDQGKETE